MGEKINDRKRKKKPHSGGDTFLKLILMCCFLGFVLVACSSQYLAWVVQAPAFISPAFQRL